MYKVGTDKNYAYMTYSTDNITIITIFYRLDTICFELYLHVFCDVIPGFVACVGR